MALFSWISIACFVTSALAAAVPRPELVARQSLCPNDAGNAGTFSQACATYANAVSCPFGIQGKAGGIVLLVHGTSGSPQGTWVNGPYVQLLPKAGPGFDVCWVSLPNAALGDAQSTAEYIAYNIKALAAKSKTGKIGLVSHSQGGLNVQWALDFWPAYRPLVSAFVGIAPDFHGTGEGGLACLAENITLGGCQASIIQQTIGSRFLGALLAKGNQALVPTTSIYTTYDEIIQPEINPVTSQLSGASNVRVQNYCGPGYVIGHTQIPYASYPYYLAVNALTNQAPANPAAVPSTLCAWAQSGALLTQFQNGIGLLAEDLTAVYTTAVAMRTKTEPLLKPYVCARGDATSYCG
ncbi:hypothetical protein JCM3774_002756 [Rhodotorula dairenensis]